MFGTIAIIKPVAGQEQAVVDKLDDWWETRRKEIKGTIASTVHRHGDELIISVVFDSEDAYRANASDPGQDKWYQDFRTLLESDPQWMDGDVLSCKHA